MVGHHDHHRIALVGTSSQLDLWIDGQVVIRTGEEFEEHGGALTDTVRWCLYYALEAISEKSQRLAYRFETGSVYRWCSDWRLFRRQMGRALSMLVRKSLNCKICKVHLFDNGTQVDWTLGNFANPLTSHSLSMFIIEFSLKTTGTSLWNLPGRSRHD